MFAAACALTAHDVAAMPGTMAMPGGWTMSMMWMRMGGQSWPAAFAMYLRMWTAMMVAMMLPSALPMLLHHRRALHRRRAAAPAATVAAAGCAYFAVWTLVGAALYPVGIGWNLAAMRWEAVSRAVPFLTGAALVVAGALQFTFRKRAGLACCRSTPGYTPLVQRGGLRAGWLYGWRQGLACGTCCAGPMIAMIVLGAMEPAVMAGVAVVIALEKMLPRPQPLVRLTGAVAMAAGVALAIRPFA